MQMPMPMPIKELNDAIQKAKKEIAEPHCISTPKSKCVSNIQFAEHNSTNNYASVEHDKFFDNLSNYSLYINDPYYSPFIKHNSASRIQNRWLYNYYKPHGCGYDKSERTFLSTCIK